MTYNFGQLKTPFLGSIVISAKLFLMLCERLALRKRSVVCPISPNLTNFVDPTLRKIEVASEIALNKAVMLQAKFPAVQTLPAANPLQLRQVLML